MYKKVIQASRPDGMAGADNQTLRDRFLINGLFVPDEVSLTYCHYERMVIGGAAPVTVTVACLRPGLAFAGSLRFLRSLGHVGWLGNCRHGPWASGRPRPGSTRPVIRPGTLPGPGSTRPGDRARAPRISNST